MTIPLGMVARGEVKLHIQGRAQTSEEVGNELGASVGGAVFGYTVLGEYVKDKKFRQSSGGDGIMCRHK